MKIANLSFQRHLNMLKQYMPASDDTFKKVDKIRLLKIIKFSFKKIFFYKNCMSKITVSSLYA